MWDRVRHLNDKSNDLLRKIGVTLIMLGLIAVLSLLFPYVAPFVVAIILSFIMDPAVRLVSKAFPTLRVRRTLAAAICTIILLAIMLFIMLTVMSRALSELRQIASVLPRNVSQWVTGAMSWARTTLNELDLIDDALRQYLVDSVDSIGKTITTYTTQFASQFARGVWNTATVTLPQVLLFITITFMSTFYFASDRERIFGFFRSLVPPGAKKTGDLVKANLFRGLLSQIRASLVLMVLTFTELSIGFALIRVDYAILLALVISLVDALPILGTGLFLLPMSIYGFFVGNIRMGIGTLLLYVIVGVVRQTVEPRIIGKGIGLHPLATMAAMYISFKVIGVVGMLLGPIIMLLCKVVIELSAVRPESALGSPIGADAAVMPLPLPIPGALKLPSRVLFNVNKPRNRNKQ